jgi:hypothetical protein
VVKIGIEAFVGRTGIDELMVTAAIFSHEARLRSFEIVAQVAIGGAQTHSKEATGAGKSSPA